MVRGNYTAEFWLDWVNSKSTHVSHSNLKSRPGLVSSTKYDLILGALLWVGAKLRRSLLTITMSIEKPSNRIYANSAARLFEKRFSDPSLTSTPLPMAVDSNRDNDMATVDTRTK